MTIAVTYEDGKVFQHFGHTEKFKLYEVSGESVLSSRILDSNGEGHEALATVLSAEGVDVLICGGIGGGAQAALAEMGIELCSGAEGDVDEVVESYLRGELASAGVNCDHHDHEEEHTCGGGCGGCHGCHQEPQFEGPNVGKTVRVHYTGTYDNGEKFDSSYDRNEPLEFVCGMGMMIRGFDEAVATMEVGSEVDVHLTPDKAYGDVNPEAVFTLDIDQLPGAEELNVGEDAYLENIYGQPFRVRVTAKDGKTITFDANHEMAGKELNFHIELVEIL